MAASTPKTFDSSVEFRGRFQHEYPPDTIKNEPMFFNCTPQYAWDNGGPVTRSFLLNLPDGWFHSGGVFDSRVHMLMPGWYPAIPGWHHDDVPRAEVPPGQHFLTAGQPDYDNPRYHAEHIMGLVGAEVCPTKFAVGHCTMPAVPTGLIYRTWHEEVEALVAAGDLAVVECESGVLYGFDWQSFHTGTKARGNGWRWFGRISRATERQPTTEIRRQVQVYLEFPMEGW